MRRKRTCKKRRHRKQRGRGWRETLKIQTDEDTGYDSEIDDLTKENDEYSDNEESTVNTPSSSSSDINDDNSSNEEEYYDHEYNNEYNNDDDDEGEDEDAILINAGYDGNNIEDFKDFITNVKDIPLNEFKNYDFPHQIELLHQYKQSQFGVYGGKRTRKRKGKKRVTRRHRRKSRRRGARITRRR